MSLKPSGSLSGERSVLLIAYHFPPLRGSSGVQRTLRFAQHLPKFGWHPVVLTIRPNAYEEQADTAGNELPAGLEVHRAFGFNAAKQLSVFGRYPAFLALPDRWATWRTWAVRKAMKIIERRDVSAVWSTFPIATAHRIGMDIARRADLPWIAEFRDPMWQVDWPTEPAANRSWKALETDIFLRADKIVCTAPSAIDLYAERFPEFGRDRLVLIENGYDEDVFSRTERDLGMTLSLRRERPVILLHSGIIYRSERDPSQLFAAVGALKRTGQISAEDLQIVLRASGEESDYARDLERHDISDIVRLEPAIDYLDALKEMMSVDGLLLLQASNCNAQVPAKLYEYLRAGRPILALTDPSGDTARTLESARAGAIARLDSAAEIAKALLDFLAAIADGTALCPPVQAISHYSREARAGQLANALNSVVIPPGG